MGMLNRLLGGNSDMMGIEQLAPQMGLQQQMPQPLPSWMASQGGAGLPPPQMPQMPPQPGGMNALQGAFSQSPQFQAQLGAIHNQTSPGYQQPTFTPPVGGQIPPFNANAGGRSGGGRSIGGAPIRGGFAGFPGNADDDILRRFLPQAPTRL